MHRRAKGEPIKLGDIGWFEGSNGSEGITGKRFSQEPWVFGLWSLALVFMVWKGMHQSLVHGFLCSLRWARPADGMRPMDTTRFPVCWLWIRWRSKQWSSRRRSLYDRDTLTQQRITRDWSPDAVVMPGW